MIVDMLLRLLGENPGQYTQSIDKWLAAETIITSSIFVILPYVLFVICWIWIIKDIKKGRVVSKKRVLKVSLVSVVVLVLGFIIPSMFDYIVAILGIRSYYGM